MFALRTHSMQVIPAKQREVKRTSTFSKSTAHSLNVEDSGEGSWTFRSSSLESSMKMCHNAFKMTPDTSNLPKQLFG